MTKIIMIRHGEAASSPEIICGRSNHLPLTSRGRAQASSLGRVLTTKPDAIWASPAKRTQETAEHTLKSAKINLPIITDEDLQELNHASFEGKVRSEVFTPKRIHEREIKELDFKLPGGESVNELVERTRRAIIRIAEAHPNQTVWVFGHRMGIKGLVGSLNKWSLDEIYNADCPNVSATTFNATREGIELVSFSEVFVD